MKLIKVLDSTNTLEKNSFYKILDSLVESNKSIEVEEILSTNNHELKNIDHENIVRVFHLVRKEYQETIRDVLESSLSQLDLLIDILIRDGNCIITRDWFAQLYEQEITCLEENVKIFRSKINNSDTSISNQRLRDYRTYRDCTKIAYTNDLLQNQEEKITHEEYSILRQLSLSLGLSNEEVRLINYDIIPIVRKSIDDIIKNLKDNGIIFYSKKNYKVYIPDEFVILMREIRGKRIADKYYRRVLLSLTDSYINRVARVHNIDHKLSKDSKVNRIINEGISFVDTLSEDIYKEDTLVSDRKKIINGIMESNGIPVKGTTIDDKINHIITHFSIVERDERVGISNEGYQQLTLDMKTILPEINDLVKEKFQLQEHDVLDSDFLLDYNIKPLDILELISDKDIQLFCERKEIKTRGNSIQNILDSYTDSKNLLLENFIHIGNRNLAELKNNNINLPSSEFGAKYEELTALMFSELGFNVDGELKSELNTKRDKIDILLRLEEDEVIIVECKTSKSTKYNKFSSVSRQIKSYKDLVNKGGFRVKKTLLIAPDFSEDFIYDCELEYELNLSLVTSEVLYNIWDGFKEARHKVFPVNLLMRDVLIDDNKILKALKVK